MLTTIEGTFRNGQVELKELPTGFQNETPVIVTFMASSGVDLRSQGMDETQAAELRAALTTFEDWNEPEMDVYDNYDAAKSNL